MSQVEKDREFLRKEHSFKPSESNISYINTFEKHKFKKQESTIVKKKISNLSTINILFAVHEGFKNMNKEFYKKLEYIRNILMIRDDLTYSLIELIERIDVIYDDLYSWYPGIKYSDPWSYFVELIPDIVQEYKNYYIRALLARDKPKDKILEVLKTRMCKGLGDFDVINRDMFMFNLDQDESEVKRLKKPGKVIKNIISKTYWNEEDSFNISQHTFNIIGAPHEKIKYSEDINLELNLGLSMIEIEVNNRIYKLTLVEFDDFLNRNDRSKIHLVRMKIIDNNWNVI